MGCVGILSASTRSLPNPLSNRTPSKSDCFLGHPSQYDCSCWLWLVYICIHVVSRRLQSPQQTCFGRLSYVSVLPCDRLDGHLAQCRLIRPDWPSFCLKSL